MNRRELLTLLMAAPVVAALPSRREELLTPGVTVGAVDVSYAPVPALSFSGDGDTGLYERSKDEIRLVVGGIDRGQVWKT